MMIRRILEPFKPLQNAETMITDENEIKREYRYWRIRMMYSTFIGYAVFYFVRQNMSIAIPLIEKNLGITKSSLGLFLTLHKLLYGLSKFINGMIGDRANPRYFMALGLMLSAAMNILFGFSTAIITMGIFWMLNGWFQGMGFPPCARTLSYWFSTGERGTKWAIWNSSHQIGASLILILAGYLSFQKMGINIPVPALLSGSKMITVSLSGWQLCFIVPALISIAIALFLINRLRDTPGSLGLPPVEEYMQEEKTSKMIDHEFDGKEFKKFLIRNVFSNKYIWLICFANFFVYILRYGFLDWAPSCLSEMKGLPLIHCGWITAGFEIFGLVGSFIAGWLTDKFFKCRRAPVCVFFMLASAVLIVIFLKLPSHQVFLNILVVFLLGFFIYGPQFLVGVMTADIATKHAAASAIGLTGLFGYLSGIISGWGLGVTVHHYGWEGGLVILSFAAVAAMMLFALCWNAKPTVSV